MNKHLEPYRHPSMAIYHKLKGQFLNDIASYEKMLTETDRGEWALKCITEFKQAAFTNIAWLEERKNEGYFADEALCADDSGWTDLKSYYMDQAEQNYEQIDKLRKLQEFRLYDPNEHGPLIEQEIRKYENFAIANLRKAGVTKYRKYVPSGKDLSTIERMIKELS